MSGEPSKTELGYTASGKAEPSRTGHSTAHDPDDQRRALAPAAVRALEEAAERRRLAAEAARVAGEGPRELGGRGGPDPARYGDWENKGIASDF